MKLAVAVTMVIFSAFLLHVVNGSCSKVQVLKCLMTMMPCAHSSAGYENGDCCDTYFDCMRACGHTNVRCGSRRMEESKRGSWNKRFDYDEFNLPFPIS